MAIASASGSIDAAISFDETSTKYSDTLSRSAQPNRSGHQQQGQKIYSAIGSLDVREALVEDSNQLKSEQRLHPWKHHSCFFVNALLLVLQRFRSCARDCCLHDQLVAPVCHRMSANIARRSTALRSRLSIQSKHPREQSRGVFFAVSVDADKRWRQYHRRGFAPRRAGAGMYRHGVRASGNCRESQLRRFSLRKAMVRDHASLAAASS